MVNISRRNVSKICLLWNTIFVLLSQEKKTPKLSSNEDAITPNVKTQREDSLLKVGLYVDTQDLTGGQY